MVGFEIGQRNISVRNNDTSSKSKLGRTEKKEYRKETKV
jgi:hypothetical protein